MIPQGRSEVEEAIARQDEAIASDPGNAAAHKNRGDTLFRLKRLDEAVASYNTAIALKPTYAEAHNNRGSVLRALARFDEAVASYDDAIVLKPDHAGAHGNRGIALQALGRLDEAIESYDQAIALDPDNPRTHSNRGNALQDLCRFEDAIASYDKTIALKPDYAEAYNNRGIALKELKRLDDAIASFDRAIALNPDNAEARWNRALAQLLAGRFDVGWLDYQARMKRKGAPVGARRYPQPVWLGDVDISGKTIFVYWEQGLGDTIQFCRYLELLDRTGATVIFQPQRPLRTLMRSLAVRARIIDDSGPPRNFDVHCPLMSLPLAFKTDLATIPRVQAYLDVPDEKVREWTQRLGKRSKPRVGITWSGSATNGNDSNRSIALEKFRALFDERFQVISVQKELRVNDEAWLERSNIAHFGDALDDFSDTAALCRLMDLVISVDTSVAHLAGALGTRVWTLLPWVPDWRWMLDRDDSPWYPSMRLFRQTARGDWDGVFHRLKQELNVLL